MAIPIPTNLVEFILLGPLDDRRQLQDSPILGDVWVEFGKNPSRRVDLLISPYRGQHAGAVAGEIEDGLADEDNEIDVLKDDNEQPNVAYLQGLVVARLTFAEVAQLVVPKTQWWISKWEQDANGSTKQGSRGDSRRRAGKLKRAAPRKHELSDYSARKVKEVLRKIIASVRNWQSKSGAFSMQEIPALDRFVALAGLILWAGQTNSDEDPSKKPDDALDFIVKNSNEKQIDRYLDEVTRLLADLKEKMLAEPEREPMVYQVSLNRSAMPALSRSTAAVKADAARTLFKVDCSRIGWGVIDSGIYGGHPAFGIENGSRVKRSFDFKSFRKIVSLSNAKPVIRKKNLKTLINDDLLHRPRNKKEESELESDLERLAVDARNRGPIHWELVEKFVEIKPNTEPPSNHGTHVAGIIGADKEAAKNVGPAKEEFADGMCPDISLYDFRVLGPGIRDTEFAIIAALQFIRYLNDRDKFFTIHGVNLSLSIPHDVRNYACGRTPICDEAERLVESGVVVVAAAGNHGYKSFETKEGSYESYAAFSITDPGNADSVITVGSTHRFWPHTYGVSFFSSRGPTGDGRIKPDLVAPGERIHGPVFNKDSSNKNEWGDLDGTSMAAPHVSGAAAMLLARYSELIGQPRRVKQILCDSATDLGRERSFQGHGMLDVLRAFQSI
ncbi:MAG: S8 family peptidase [Acidobacteriota bacterium]